MEKLGVGGNLAEECRRLCKIGALSHNSQFAEHSITYVHILLSPPNGDFSRGRSRFSLGLATDDRKADVSLG